MAILNEKFSISAHGYGDFIDITEKIKGIVRGANIKDAVVNVITTNPLNSVIMADIQNNLDSDIKNFLNSILPINNLENNPLWQNEISYSWLKANLLGHVLTLSITDNELKMENYQKIIFVDFNIKQSNNDVVVAFTY